MILRVKVVWLLLCGLGYICNLLSNVDATLQYCLNPSSVGNTSCVKEDILTLLQWDDISDDAYGSINAEIELPFIGCNCTSSGILLYVNETVQTEEECVNSVVTSSVQTYHTGTYLNFYHGTCKSECERNCDNKHKLVLPYKFIFTGCYIVQVKSDCVDMDDPKVESQAKFIKSNYIKHLINGAPEYYKPEDVEFQAETIQINFNTWKFWTGLNLTIKNTDTNDVYNKILTKPINEPISNSNCASTDEYLTCEFFNISQGHYTLLLSLLDDVRCVQSSLWAPLGCTWTREFDVTYPLTSNLTKPGSPWNVKALIAIISAVLLTIIIAATITYRLVDKICNRKNAHAETFKRTDILADGNPNDVLLLYTRGSEEFMNFMIKFRHIFMDQGKHVVYDMYDRHRLTEICAFQQEWILHKFRCKCKIVLVINTDALKLCDISNRTNGPIMNIYDQLFIFAIKQIMQNYELMNYSTLFVAHLECELKTDFRMFDFVNRYMRYVLPVHISKLLSSIYGSEFAENEFINSNQLKDFYAMYAEHQKSKSTDLPNVGEIH